MHRKLAVVLVFVLAVSFGCGTKQKEEEGDLRIQEKAKTERPEGRDILPLVDPVDGTLLDERSAEFVYVYEGQYFSFNSRENMEKFKENPEKYLSAQQ